MYEQTTLILALFIPLTTASVPVGLRYAWESYPNCALYSGAEGGPVAGGDSVYGGIAPGCNRKPKPGETWTGVPPDCVYEGHALPATPFQIEL